MSIIMTNANIFVLSKWCFLLCNVQNSQASRKARKVNTSKRAADTSTSQLQDEEELPHVGPDVAESFFIPADVHPWLRFDQRWVHYAKYARNLFSLLKKEFTLSRYVDWEPLDAIGLSNQMRELLIQRFEYGGNMYEFTEWERLFNIREPVFKELCYEFFSTLTLQRDITAVTDANFMKFRLGGEPRFLSMRQLAECLGIYTQAELAYTFFDDYLVTGVRIHDTGDFVEGEFWEQFSEKEFEPSSVSYKDMNNTLLRVIHRFITHTIANRRENNEKVTLADIWYLRQIYEKDHINFPYCVANYLDTTAGGLKDKSPIVGGHFVTLIAKGLGVNFRIRPALTPVDLNQKSVGYLMYHAAEAVSKNKKGFIPYPEKQASEQPQQPQRRQRAQQQQQDPVQGAAVPSLLDIMHGVEGLQVHQNEWRHELNDWQNQVDYRIGNIEYQAAWGNNNLSWLAEQQGYMTTRAEPLYQWGTAESRSHPPPVYDHESALAEAQRRHQDEYDRQVQEDLVYHDAPSGTQSWDPWPQAHDHQDGSHAPSSGGWGWPY